ncbi:MAG: hypothetical protein H5U36_04720 [Candidatus Caldatribacterium sp.]|nr:hypothetical protein [Candidatus Caldatribacterium sp.]
MWGTLHPVSLSAAKILSLKSNGVSFDCTPLLRLHGLGINDIIIVGENPPEKSGAIVPSPHMQAREELLFVPEGKGNPREAPRRWIGYNH